MQNTTPFLSYYESLLREAFVRTYGFALAQLGLTLLLAILGVIFYLGWKKYLDRERTALKDGKALLAAAIMPVIVVFGGRFLWNAACLVVERQEQSAQTVEKLTTQIHNLQKEKADRATRSGRIIDQIEKSNPYSQQVRELGEQLKIATSDRERAESDYAQTITLQKQAGIQGPHDPTRFGAMHAAEYREAQIKSQLQEQQTQLTLQLESLRTP